MTTEQLYELEEFEHFIAKAEELWLTFLPKEKLVEVFFGTIENAQRLLKMFIEDKEIWDFKNNNFK